MAALNAGAPVVAGIHMTARSPSLEAAEEQTLDILSSLESAESKTRKRTTRSFACTLSTKCMKGTRQSLIEIVCTDRVETNLSMQAASEKRMYLSSHEVSVRPGSWWLRGWCHLCAGHGSQAGLSVPLHYTGTPNITAIYLVQLAQHHLKQIWQTLNLARYELYFLMPSFSAVCSSYFC